MKKSAQLRQQANTKLAEAWAAAGGTGAINMQKWEGMVAALDDTQVDNAVALMREYNGLNAQVASAEAEERAAEDRRAELIGGMRQATASTTPPHVLAMIRGGNPSGMDALDAIEVGADRATLAPLGGFKSAGHFFDAVRAAGRQTYGLDRRLELLGAAAGMNGMSGPDGGFLIPGEISQQIYSGITADADNLLAQTDNYTVTGAWLEFPRYVNASMARGSRHGGVRAYWKKEAEELTASAPKFDTMRLEPHKLTALVYVTSELLAGASIALEQYINRCTADAINFEVGDAIINGDGINKPKGLLGSDATIEVAKESGQTAATVVMANLTKMWARLSPAARARAVWMIHPDAEQQLHGLTLTVGTGGVPVYLPPGGLADTPQARLFGRPVVTTEYNQALGTKGDIILGDLKQYATGSRGGIQAAMSMHVLFLSDQSAFRFLFFVDGQPWAKGPVTPAKGSTTISSFVTLATRA